MYHFYLGGVHLPVAPGEMTIKTGSKNTTVSLVDGRDINIIKEPGLKEISFKALIPNKEYYFANYMSNFKPANEIVNSIMEYKIQKVPFRFVVSRARGNDFLFFTDINVTLESCNIYESAYEGYDTVLEIKLKEYVEYATKVYELDSNNNVTAVNTYEEKKPEGTTYTVKSGDCLWDIAKGQYGDGSRYKEIYEANKNIISDPRVIRPGMVLTLP